jgi:hypothetical protein
MEHLRGRFKERGSLLPRSERPALFRPSWRRHNRFMTRYAADTIEAVGSAVALVGIPAVAWLGFVGLIEAVSRSLGLL